MEDTLTFSARSNGWTSRWSFIPDWMTGLNNSFYTWKNGELYKHDTNTKRNEFYGVQYPSTITPILNMEPAQVKVFKTLAIDSNMPWDTKITTDLVIGEIAQSQYEPKEGEWYAYIRRDDTENYDTRALSTQGLGQALSLVGNTINFSFNIGNNISNGDTIYKVSLGNLVKVGTVLTHTATAVTLSAAPLTSVSPGDMIVYVKNSVAESYGARGFYMEVKLSLMSDDYAEIFAVSSNVFKSNY
jgi:hypothetical protein